MDKPEFARWTILYTVLISLGSIVLLKARAGTWGTPFTWFHVVTAIFASACGGVVITMFQAMMLRGGRSIFLGSSENETTPLTLSRVRTLTKQEAWLEAREELDRLWIMYPGNGEILQEYEHVLVDHMHAPSGFADFLIKAVPVLKGDEKAYALFRIAELFAGILDRKPEAGLWCHRLMVEHPGSHYEEQARMILESLPRADKKG